MCPLDSSIYHSWSTLYPFPSYFVLKEVDRYRLCQWASGWFGQCGLLSKSQKKEFQRSQSTDCPCSLTASLSQADRYPEQKMVGLGACALIPLFLPL